MVRENLREIRGEIEKAAMKAGRNPADIKIIAVTKNIIIDRIVPVINEGLTDLGENRVQEFLEKQPLLGTDIQWHLIGHLQTNKVKAVVGKISLIHSLDSWRLALEIDKKSKEADVVQEVLVQVNVSGENTKYGLSPQEVYDFVRDGHDLKGITIRGLMTIAPFVNDPEEVRPYFRELRDLLNRLRKKMPALPMTLLSMGMTNDYQVAVEEGANILRIGTGIFSDSNS